MMLILIIILVVFALGGLPAVGLHQYGYGPSGLVGVILIILVVMLLLGHWR
jgi:hypothetical protein